MKILLQALCNNSELNFLFNGLLIPSTITIKNDNENGKKKLIYFFNNFIELNISQLVPDLKIKKIVNEKLKEISKKLISQLLEHVPLFNLNNGNKNYF